MTRALIVDMLARGAGKRLSTIDVVGAGPRAVAGVLEQAGVEVSLMVGEQALRFKEKLKEYDLLLVSGMTSDLPGVKKIVKIWRDVCRNKPIIAGGPIWSKSSILLETGVDIIVLGEAEATLEELMYKAGLKDGLIDYNVLSEIRGLMYKAGGKAYKTGRRPYLKPNELSRFRASARIARHYPNYWALRFYVEVVRGCSNMRIPEVIKYLKPHEKPRRKYVGCAYCSVASCWGPSRSICIERVYREIKELIDVGVKRIVLSAPDFLDYYREELLGKPFCSNPRSPRPNLYRIKQLLSLIDKIPEVACREVVVMIENIKPNFVGEDEARVLGYYLEGTPVHMGVESGDEKILKLMGRPHTLSEAINAIKLLRKNKLRPYVYLLYGLPLQDEGSIEKTIAILPKIIEAGAEKITLYRFTPLPYTALENCRVGDPNISYNKRLIKSVARANVELKKSFIGKVVQVIVCGRYKSYYVGYPITHGPVTLIKSYSARKSIIGYRVKVLIEKVESDRLMIGRLLKIGRRVSRGV